jgi:hypothetical protein
MPKVVYFKPLDGFGESPVDLEACPRMWELYGLDQDHPDFPHEGGEEAWIYLSPENRWIEHKHFYDPWTKSWEHIFKKISQVHVIDELKFYYDSLGRPAGKTPPFGAHAHGTRSRAARAGRPGLPFLAPARPRAVGRGPTGRRDVLGPGRMGPMPRPVTPTPQQAHVDQPDRTRDQTGISRDNQDVRLVVWCA